jgi:hypothetical protein
MSVFKGQTFLPFLDPDLPVPMPEPAARATDPTPSHEAAEGAKDFAACHIDRILKALQLGPASKTELWRRTSISDVACARRCSDLVSAGKLIVISEDGRSLTGKRERVYALPWQAMRAAK